MKQIKIGKTPLVVDVPESSDLPPAREVGSLKRYSVRLAYVGMDVVEASGPDEAFEMFKASRSINATDHVPEILEVTEEEAAEAEAVRPPEILEGGKHDG